MNAHMKQDLTNITNTQLPRYAVGLLCKKERREKERKKSGEGWGREGSREERRLTLINYLTQG
jgi:hypothetical protein